jgi:hypothetical protein
MRISKRIETTKLRTKVEAEKKDRKKHTMWQSSQQQPEKGAVSMGNVVTKIIKVRKEHEPTCRSP